MTRHVASVHEEKSHLNVIIVTTDVLRSVAYLNQLCSLEEH